jgi:hypothetical protein
MCFRYFSKQTLFEQPAKKFGLEPTNQIMPESLYALNIVP